MNKKHLLFLIPFVLLSSCKSNQGDDPVSTAKNRIILLAGQSNMVGYSSYSDLMEDSWFDTYLDNSSNVKIISNCENRFLNKSFHEVSFGYGRTTNHFGPEVGITHILKEDSDVNYYLVKVAWGSTGLVNGDWQSESSGETGIMYERLLDEIDNATEILTKDLAIDDYEISALCWMQGENDASNLTKSINYEEYMKNFVYDLRKYTKNQNLFIVDAFISKSFSYTSRINDAKKNLQKTLDHYCTIDTISEDLMTNVTDIYHYTPESEIRLGELFGQQILTL